VLCELISEYKLRQQMQQQVPTFKLVLVGDGGTGMILLLISRKDDVCEETFDGRV
jgi:hypothetical protein